MRNVLLKRQGNGLVAKLIGFGPNAEDGKAEKSGGDVSCSITVCFHVELLDAEASLMCHFVCLPLHTHD